MTEVAQRSSLTPRYDALLVALSDAESTDEVLDIKDRSDAMREAARIAKDKALEVRFANLRLRAERRLGEMIASQKESDGLNQGARLTGSTPATEKAPKSSAVVVDDRRPKLADAGISKDLSARAQKLAAVPEKEFEAALTERERAVVEDGKKVSVSAESIVATPRDQETSGPVVATRPPSSRAFAKLEARLDKVQGYLQERTDELEAEKIAHAATKEDLQRAIDIAIDQGEVVTALEALRDNQQFAVLKLAQERARMLEAQLATNERTRDVMQKEIIRLHRVEAKFKKLAPKK